MLRLLVLLLLAFATTAHAATLTPASGGEGSHASFVFTVTTALDSGDPNPGDGTCGSFFLGCSLRAAIEEANATPSTLRVTIEFDIRSGPAGSDLGDGAWRIEPSSALPIITRENTTLDALTQPGALCGGLTSSTFPLPHVLKVVLSGAAFPGGTGLYASPVVSNIDIRGFVVQDFGTGIIVGGAGSEVECNYIGTNAAGDSLGNAGAGVVCASGSGVRIGTGDAPNTIAFNGEDGVRVSSGCQVAVVGNAIHSNVGLGVDLYGTEPDGPTPNDPGDADTGGNGLQNYPVVTSAASDGVDSFVEWTLDSTPNTTFELSFCRLDEPDPTGYGECPDPAAAVTATTDPRGYASGLLRLSGALFPVNDWVSASATVVDGPLPRGYGATSEFSPAVQVGLPTPAFTARITPTGPTPPVVLQRGDYLFFDVVFEVGPTGPSSFELWTEAVLPNGSVRSPLIGPVTVNVSPPESVTLSFSQRVPNIAPFGSYTYRLEAGTFPGTVLDEDSFPLDIVSGRTAGPDDWEAFDASGARLTGPQTYDLRTAASDGDTEAASRGEAVPTEATLAGAYPNPFTQQATVAFALPESQRVRLVVYDVLGRTVAVLVDGDVEAGRHEAVLDGRGLPAGVYLVRFATDAGVQTQRVTLVR